MTAFPRSLALSAALLAASASPLFAQDDGAQPEDNPAEAAAKADEKPEITKEVLAEGEGDVCGNGRIVQVHYTGTLEDGKKFDSSRDRGDPFVFEVGTKSVIEGWDEVVAQMRVGDRWKVLIPWQKAYGISGSPPNIPPKTDLVFDIELLGFLELDITKIAEAGGEKPELGKYVEANIKVEVDGETPKVLTDTFKGNTGTLQVGRPTQLKGLDLMLKRMRPGDHWKVRLPPELGYGSKGVPQADVPGGATLVLELEMIRVLEPEIEIITDSDGATPRRGQRCTIHYIGTFTDGKKFDSSRDRDEPLQVVLGAGQVIPGWEMTIAQMKVGQRIKVTIPWQFAYGAAGRPGIPGKSDLVFDMELISVE